MPPRAVKRPSTATALKKKTPIRENEYKEFVPRELDESERLELEDNDIHTDAEEHGGGNVGMERHWDMEGSEDSIDGENVADMMEGYEELRKEEMGKEGVRDEHGVELDEFESEHHDVVKERRKRKEFEVFVGGLDRDATEEDLGEVFSQVGKITELRLLKNPITKKNKGFAFIRFATVEQARRAVNELKHPVVNGKQCGVAPSQDSDTLFVGNICKQWTKEILKDKLADFGVEDFEELTLVEDTKNEGMNRGFAFLDFSSRADALEACKRLQKRDVVFGTDRTARVAFADTFIEPDDEIMAQVRIVFIDGLPSTWDEDRVEEHLKKYGRIEKIELARNMPAAKRTDFGFITFDTHDAAVACVDGVNNSEIGYGDKKVKVRARLSRPRQRGKSSKHARGGYPVEHGGLRGVKTSWGSSVPHMDSWRFTGRSGRSIQSRSAYDGGLRRSLDSRDRHPIMDVVPDRVGSRRRFPSPERSFSRRSPVLSYGKSSLQKKYMREDESFSRPHDFARSHTERHSYKVAYPSHGSGYLESSPRSFSHGVTRRMSPLYDDDDDGYERYIEQPSSYREGHSRDYGSFSGSKRSYSAIEEAHPRHAESSIRQSRGRSDYGGSNSRVPYGEVSYGSDSARLRRGSRSVYDGGRNSSGHSHGLYDTGTSSMGYRREEISRGASRRSHEMYDTGTSSMGYQREEIRRGDVEGLYSSYARDQSSRDYLPSRSDMDAISYSPVYTSRRINDGYLSGRDSGSYY
ncbi:uncharacterized protein LOC132300283 isoform X2 [Cornus florida]|uniref:uncharacterized protein LOC132300283 isoform X2 n=1 Tax=Cornus florida TaxID=4283 RepID=UPI00289C3E61|nr:uncharacterized protein LOC132300283 isoform X2 [Cornus florida]